MNDPVFVDTNVFLRFFARDVEAHYQKAHDLFKKAEKGELKLETNDLVMAEIVWVLESYYEFSSAEIKEVIETILETKNLKVSNGQQVRSAIQLYASGPLDYIDACNIAYMQAKGYSRVATFDRKHFKNVEGVELIW